jgi:hypothetical protein
MRRALLVSVALLSVGCAGAIRLAPVTPGSVADPASPEPPPPPTSQTLRQESDRPGPTVQPDHKEGEAMPSPMVYTCPMHHEVRSDTPGTCPKCGMKLVPAKPAPATESPR